MFCYAAKLMDILGIEQRKTDALKHCRGRGGGIWAALEEVQGSGVPELPPPLYIAGQALKC